ncbi:MAG TPA: PGPGW domain-containing protein [Solirubrobacteraceae bacterium]|nr:PGPGW domain-containing protein [Solirubrobacteraceae bacterium]
MQGERRRPRLVETLAARREHHLRRNRFYRLLFALAGTIVTLTGLALLVLPGPAFVVIPIGLAMLAMEFAWAERWLEKAIVQAQAAQEKAAGASPAQKVLGGIATALGIAAFLAAALLWDIPVLPV